MTITTQSPCSTFPSGRQYLDVNGMGLCKPAFINTASVNKAGEKVNVPTEFSLPKLTSRVHHNLCRNRCRRGCITLTESQLNILRISAGNHLNSFGGF